ncbi:hypothetical protein Plhal304r1_c008g0033571 [Plasmopara halstedii]
MFTATQTLETPVTERAVLPTSDDAARRYVVQIGKIEPEQAFMINIASAGHCHVSFEALNCMHVPTMT